MVSDMKLFDEIFVTEMVLILVVVEDGLWLRGSC